VTNSRLALAGLFGPPLFGVLVVLATALEWDFLHTLAWSAGPFDSPDAPWPSIAALGDYGLVVSLAFVLLGLSILALAYVLLRLLAVRRKYGVALLGLFGAAAALAVIRTDYRTAYGGGPNTWNGTVNAVAFSIFVPAAVVSMLSLAAQFRRDERWRPLVGRSALAGFAALVSIVAFLATFANLFFWIYLAIVLAWLMLVSARALSLSPS